MDWLKEKIEELISLQSRILEVITNLAPGSPQEIWMDSADIKALLKISDRTLCMMRKNKLIDHKKIGKKIFHRV